MFVWKFYKNSKTLAYPSELIQTKEEPQWLKEPQQESELMVSQEVLQGFVVKSYNGKVAVFGEGSTEPGEVLSVYVKDLPEADRKFLEYGISARNEEELSKILEDYCS
jgi:hypothetical protein